MPMMMNNGMMNPMFMGMPMMGGHEMSGFGNFDMAGKKALPLDGAEMKKKKKVATGKMPLEKGKMVMGGGKMQLP